MIRPRIIPTLLLHEGALTKTTQFKKHNYIGDPMNAVHLFNQLKADEIVFLDIDASKEGRSIDLDLVREIGEEARMPFSVGGGIRDLETIAACVQAGAERVILGEVMYTDPDFIKRAVDRFGSSTISVCIDYHQNWLKQTKVAYRNGSKSVSIHPKEQALKMQALGVGEIIFQSIDRDGTQKGYDTPFLKEIAEELKIPIVALGGAATKEDLKQLALDTSVRGIAAGSLFIYHGNNKGVLINYPERKFIADLYLKS